MVKTNDISSRLNLARSPAWKWSGILLGVLLIELWLAYYISPTILTDYSVASSYTEFMYRFASVVHNFDRIAIHREALSFYFALTLWFLIPKTAFFYWWFNSNPIANRNFFVVSPLTTTEPRSVVDFPSASLNATPAAERPRSLFSRMFWSIAILLFWVGCTTIMMEFGWEISKGRNHVTGVDPIGMARGGILLWSYWSLEWMMFWSFVTAIAYAVAHDCVAATKIVLGKLAR